MRAPAGPAMRSRQISRRPTTGSAERTAGRLFRAYPREWRAQFPDFASCLQAQLEENDSGVRRNVLRAAAIERLRASGLLAKLPSDRARTGLGLIYGTLVPFVVLALGMASQLRVGIGSQAATSPVLRGSDLLMTVAALGALVALPCALVLMAHEGRRGSRRTRLIVPAGVLIAAFATLTLDGWVADRSGWYSPAAAALPSAGISHLLTLWVRGAIAPVTPAWFHPSLFGLMPSGQIFAAFSAPPALLATAASLFVLISRLPLKHAGRADLSLAVLAFAVMCLSVVASCRWLIAHPDRTGATPALARADQIAPGHTGWTVIAGLTMLAVVAMTGLHRVVRSRQDRLISQGTAETAQP